MKLINQIIHNFVLITIFIISLQSIAISGTIELPQTGQTTVYATGDDGDIPARPCRSDGQAGVAWPSPRFTDNEDSTMTDNLTGLVWTQDATLSGETI